MKTIEYGNALIRISRPSFTEGERKKAEQKVLIALQLFGKAKQDAERMKNEETL